MALVACLAVFVAGIVLSGCGDGQTQATDISSDAQQMRDAAKGIKPGPPDPRLHSMGGGPAAAPKSSAAAKPHGRTK